MDKALKLVGIAALGAGMMVFVSIAGAVFGAIGGWLTGLFFGDQIIDVLGRFGVVTDGLALWQVGLMLGFVGGFFRAVQTNNGGK